MSNSYQPSAKQIVKRLIPESTRIRVKGWLRRAVVNITGPDLRHDLALLFIKGHGIEIGALHMPLPVGPDATVSYVDRLSMKDLRQHYPELRRLPLVEPDIIADGQTLTGIENATQDFVIANHFLEHAEDPIGTIRHFARVLRPGGILFIALPDKRFTFDQKRPETSNDHLQLDHERGPQASRQQHYVEWARLVENIEDASHAAARATELENTGYSIHFHVWTLDTAHEFISNALTDIGRSYEFLSRTQNPAREEMIFVISVGNG
jgi:predicted SAM-dependent methyltransferase